MMIWLGMLAILLPLLVICMVCALFPKGYRFAQKLTAPLMILSGLATGLGIYMTVLCWNEIPVPFWFPTIPLGLCFIAWLVRIWTRQRLGKSRRR